MSSPVAPARPVAVVVTAEVPAVEADVPLDVGKPLATEADAALEFPVVPPAPDAVAPPVVVAASRTDGAAAPTVTVLCVAPVAAVLLESGRLLPVVLPAPATLANVLPAVVAVPAAPLVPAAPPKAIRSLKLSLIKKNIFIPYPSSRQTWGTAGAKTNRKFRNLRPLQTRELPTCHIMTGIELSSYSYCA